MYLNYYRQTEENPLGSVGICAKKYFIQNSPTIRTPAIFHLIQTAAGITRYGTLTIRQRWIKLFDARSEVWLRSMKVF
jgi:hypothetical protein